MAWLEGPGPSSTVTLAARSVVGRAPNCSVRPADRRVSGEHATIAWSGERWEIRDLGSRNGTFVNGQRIEVRRAVPLSVGDQLGFGGVDEVWRLADASPPVATARRVGSGEVLVAEGQLLALPSADEPWITVYQDMHGTWQAESTAGCRAVEDGEVLDVDGQAWALHLPTTLEPTVDVDQRNPAFGELELSFSVSSDEEDVELIVRHEGQPLELGGRAHHFVLLLLARARLEDAQQPGLSEAEHGWRYVEDVCQMLRVDDLRLNTAIYRARKELGAIGVRGAPQLVERRRSSRSLRLGTGAVTVTRSGPIH
ncbi:MAG: FHA domain-containing protein [Myxococcota bacterium]